jgi:hypothetical protein
MDEKVTLSDQMEEKNVGAVILINKFTLNPEDVDQFLKTWPQQLKSPRNYLESYLYNFTVELPVVESLWRTLFLSLLKQLSNFITALTFNLKYRSILPAS